jgi:hypothetical protein
MSCEGRERENGVVSFIDFEAPKRNVAVATVKTSQDLLLGHREVTRFLEGGPSDLTELAAGSSVTHEIQGSCEERGMHDLKI